MDTRSRGDSGCTEGTPGSASVQRVQAQWTAPRPSASGGSGWKTGERGLSPSMRRPRRFSGNKAHSSLSCLKHWGAFEQRRDRAKGPRGCPFTWELCPPKWGPATSKILLDRASGSESPGILLADVVRASPSGLQMSLLGPEQPIASRAPKAEPGGQFGGLGRCCTGRRVVHYGDGAVRHGWGSDAH